jgi:signal transduction histidine kinase
MAWRRRLLGVERQYEAVLGERTRIAREIHDTLAQGFVAVSVQLELIAQLMQSSVDAAREQLAQARSMVKSSLEDARISIWELRSQTAEHEDLASRLLKLAEEVIARGGSRARAQMQVSGSYRPLDAAVEREVLRIGREAVTNAVRHGDPRNLLLRLEYDAEEFGMEIRDDGGGFDGPPADGATGHFGLTGMRERATAIGGSLTVESRAGQETDERGMPAGSGTKVRLQVPLGKETANRTKA